MQNLHPRPLLFNSEPPSLHGIAPLLRQIDPVLSLPDSLLAHSHALGQLHGLDAAGRVLLVEALDGLPRLGLALLVLGHSRHGELLHQGAAPGLQRTVLAHDGGVAFVGVAHAGL